MVPVTLIALSTFGLGLHGLAVHVALPALAVLGVLVATRRAAGALAVSALGAGVAATAVYDASRFGFMWAGAVDHDPIPHIGTALGLEPAAVFGYLWRYLGNGTGLALAFLALGLRGVGVGAAYGLAVCTGLLATLAVSPHGEELLFALTPGTVLMATVGHAIFGAVMGSIAGPRPSGRVRVRRRRLPRGRRRGTTVDRLGRALEVHRGVVFPQRWIRENLELGEGGEEELDRAPAEASATFGGSTFQLADDVATFSAPAGTAPCEQRAAPPTLSALSSRT